MQLAAVAQQQQLFDNAERDRRHQQRARERGRAHEAARAERRAQEAADAAEEERLREQEALQAAQQASDPGPSSAAPDTRPGTVEQVLAAMADAERDIGALRGDDCKSGIATPAITALKKEADGRGLALPAAVGKRKRGQPLPTGYVVVTATEDVVPPGHLPACIHLVSMLTRAAMLSNPLAVIPFNGPGGKVVMALMTEEALATRRTIASGLTDEKIKALRNRPDPKRPDFSQ